MSSLNLAEKSRTMGRVWFLCTALALFSTVAAAQSDAPKGDPQLGWQLFQSKGCYSCHGFVGQGSREGPRLTPVIAFPAFIAQLRTPRAIMPPYEQALVSDKQAADIHAYLENLPQPPDPKTVRLLQ
jgi:ubiquinol-cytochrome c reductase cytochrome c subunit